MCGGFGGKVVFLWNSFVLFTTCCTFNGTLIPLIFMMNADNYRYSEITDIIIKSFYKVFNTLGFGFLEKVYENALCIELQSAGL